MTREQRYPEPIAGGIVIGPDGDVLLLKSHKWRNKFSIPGGHVELGESLSEAVVREVKEETGLEVLVLEFLGVRESIFDTAYWRERHFIMFNYLCRADSAVVTLDSESENYAWVPLKEALSMPVESHAAEALREYADRVRASGTG